MLFVFVIDCLVGGRFVCSVVCLCCCVAVLLFCCVYVLLVCCCVVVVLSCFGAVLIACSFVCVFVWLRWLFLFVGLVV